MHANSAAHAAEAGAAAPLADWTPQQQIAQMLELCEAQMESAMAESDLAVDSLVRAFSGVADAARALGTMSKNLPPQAPRADGFDRQVDALTKQVAAAVMAFQFYDKLTQRLDHVRYSLSTLAKFVCDGKLSSEQAEWQRLFATLERLYRTQEEREIFQMMVGGASAHEAREHIHQSTATLRLATSGEIELF
jgi:hypothetical protein